MNHPRSADQPDDRPSSTWAGPVGSMHMMHPQNVQNTSVGDAPILNFTFNTPNSRQDLETIVEPIVARADHEIYYHQLLTKKRGSPLWVPGPGMQLPVEYRRQGISIGDVGIITSTGTFDFLFNLFLPANDAINVGSVPQTFSPLSREQVEREIQKTCDYGPNSYVTSSSARRTKATTERRWFSLTSSTQQTFESTSGEAAILTMPDGASTRNLLATLQVEQCISENAQNWYEYAINERGRAVQNGDIRVVIGIDKVKSWGIATSTCNAGQSASLTFKPDRTSRYCWDCTGGSGRVGPAEVEITDLIQNTIIPENQCVFVRTMNFTLSGEIWYDFPSQAVVQSRVFSGQGDSVSANRGGPEGSHTSGEAGASTRPQTSFMQGTSRPVIFCPMRHGIDYHPSAKLHTRLHEKFPNASTVITQDSDWISVLHDDDNLFPEPEELVERILKSFNPTERDGGSLLPLVSPRDSAHLVSSPCDSTTVSSLDETKRLLDVQACAKADPSLKKSGNQAPSQGGVPFYTTPTYSDIIDPNCQNVTLPATRGIALTLGMTLIKRLHSAIIPVRPSYTTSRSLGIIVAHPLAPAPASSLPQASAKDGSIAFNDKVEKELDVEIAHTLFHRRQVNCVQFSPDGKYLAAGCHDGKAYIYDVKSGTLTCVLRNLFSKEDPINTICFSRDIKYLATGSWDGNLYIWEIKTKHVRNDFKGHTRYIISLDFSPNGQQLISTSNDNTVRLWNMRDGAARFLTEENPTFLDNPCYTSAVFSPDGLYVAASHRDGMVRIWSARTGQLMRRLKAHLRSACDVAFVPDGKGLISGGSDSTLRYWNVSSLYTAPIRARLQAGDPLGEASRMEEQTKAERELLGHNGSIQCLAISPDGNWVVSGSRDQTVRIWDTRNAELLCNPKHHLVLSVDFSPAGDYLASGGYDGKVRIWSCSSR